MSKPLLQTCNFFKMDMSQNSRNDYFSEIKAPAGGYHREFTFSEFTSRELIHFYRDLKNGVSPIFGFFGNVLPSNWDFLLNIKMVRMVYRKGFYSTELEICDEKMKLWRKGKKKTGRSKHGKSVLRSKICLLRGFSKTEWYLKIFRHHLESFWLDFQLKFYYF